MSVLLESELRDHSFPILKSLEFGAIRNFLQKFRLYQHLAGALPVVELLEPRVLKKFSLLFPEIDVYIAEDNVLLDALEGLNGPISSIDALDQYKFIRMEFPKDLDNDSLLNYIVDFQNVDERCPEAFRPCEMKRVEIFVSGLKPRRLRDLVESESPGDLDDAYRLALKEFKEIVNTARICSQNQFQFLERPQLTHIKPRHISIPSQPPIRQPVCHHCGAVGHIRPHCPQLRKKSSWRRDESGRLSRPTSGTIPAAAMSPRVPGPGRPVPVSASSNRTVPANRVSSLQEYNEVMDCTDLPYCKGLVLSPCGFSVSVTQLLDTGSELSTISTEIADLLIANGAKLIPNPRNIHVGGEGKVQVQSDLMCNVKIFHPSVEAEIFQMIFTVMNNGVDLIIGMPHIRKFGLVKLFQESEEPEEAEMVPNENQDSSMEALHSVLTMADDVNGNIPEITQITRDEIFVDLPAESTEKELPFIEESPFSADILQMVLEFQELFSPVWSSTGVVDIKAFPIELLDGMTPKAVPPRRASPAMRAKINEKVQDLLARNIIRPTLSEYAAPIVMVQQGSDWRLCIDYRELNNCSKLMVFPLPNIKATLERLRGKKIFGTFDLRSGYHQLPVHPDSIPLTGFVTPDGHYEFLRLPFGLKSAPAYFQCVMSEILSGLIGIAVEVFIDDLIVYAETPEAFLKNLRLVFERFRKHNLRFRASKCKIGCSKVVYLGHVVDGHGISLSEERKQGLLTMKAPSCTAQVRSFLGLANYMRAFVQNFSILIKPLSRLCSPKISFQWTSVEQDAFEQIKAAIVDAPVLHHLDYSKEIILRTDASSLGVGGVLLQRVGNQEHYVCYLSRAFNETEKKWSTVEQEGFAIYYCVTQCESYLLGHHFILETDHENLLRLSKLSAPKIVRWRMALSIYNFTVLHIPGKQNIVADCLSRCLVMDNQHPHFEEIVRAHNGTVGHRGVRLTLDNLLKMGCEWPSMREDIKDFVASCATCQKTRLGQGNVQAELHVTSVYEPFSVVDVDTIGPLPAADNGHKYIIVLICCFTRFVELVPAEDVSAKAAAVALLNVFGRFGPPQYLRSDRGSQFVCQLIDEFLCLVYGGVRRQLTMAYRPEANGLVERCNQEVMRHLRALVMDRRLSDRWYLALPLVQRIINSTVHSATGISPARLVFGDCVTLDRGLLFDYSSANMTTVSEYMRNILEVQDILMQNAESHQRQRDHDYLATSPENPTTFEIGDLVLVSYPNRPPSKLAPRWRGPYRVVNVMDNTLTLLDLVTERQIEKHVSMCKKFQVQDSANLLDIAAVDSDHFLIDKIVDHVGNPRRKKSLQFRVRFQGYGEDDDLWYNYNDCKDFAALDAYAILHPELHL